MGSVESYRQKERVRADSFIIIMIQILIINNDVEFEEALIKKLLKVQREENCSLVSPKMMFYNNKTIF